MITFSIMIYLYLHTSECPILGGSLDIPFHRLYNCFDSDIETVLLDLVFALTTRQKLGPGERETQGYSLS